MSDRPSARDRDAVAPGDPRDDDGWAPELFEDPPVALRGRRRRLVTPLTVTLLAVVLATAAFIAGVQVQKHQADGPGTTVGLSARGAAGGAARAGFAGGAGGGGQPPGETTFGSVANKKGSSLYVQSADGTTVRVKTNAQSKVTRTAAASARGIYPGDTVVVQGAKDKNGSIVATHITATSKSAAASGGGLRGGGLRQAFGAPPGG